PGARRPLPDCAGSSSRLTRAGLLFLVFFYASSVSLSVSSVAVRRRGLRRRGGDQSRNFAFDALGRDDDRVRQTFRTAAVLPQDFVGLLAAGPLHGHPLELLPQPGRGQPAALEAIA